MQDLKLMFTMNTLCSCKLKLCNCVKFRKKREMKRGRRRLEYHHNDSRRRILGCTSSVGNFIHGQDSFMHEGSLES